MSIGIAFWVLMIIWLALGIYQSWPNPLVGGHNFLLFVIIGLLGWHAFGAPIHG